MGFRNKIKKTYKTGKKAYGLYKKHESTAKQALVLAKRVARMVNVEYKYFDTTLSNSITNTGIINPLCSPTQGDTVNGRDGDSIKLMHISGRLVLTKAVAATNTQVRIILFRGKIENGASFLPADILQIVSVISPKSYTEKFRTKVMHDKIYTLDTVKTSVINMNWNFKLFGHMNFVSGATTVEAGGLYMFMLSNEAVNLPVLQYYLRTTFTDN